jgi:hypothetical protein
MGVVSVSQYPAIRSTSSTALDAFRKNNRIARRGQREVEQTVIRHMVEYAKRESRSDTLARMAVSGAARSMDVARRIANEAEGDPMCLEIGAAYVEHHIAADLADFEATARLL